MPAEDELTESEEQLFEISAKQDQIDRNQILQEAAKHTLKELRDECDVLYDELRSLIRGSQEAHPLFDTSAEKPAGG